MKKDNFTKRVEK